MSRPSTILVRTPPRPYTVFVGRDHAERTLGRLIGDAGDQAPVVTSRRVWSAVGRRLGPWARRASRPILLPDREHAKTWAQVGAIHDAFLNRRLRRSGTLVAVGGGSVGDAAGFAAATYMRGVDWIVVPTTLLAMVDSAIGGKVGINHPRSKNLIGAFHQPRAVVIDLAFLSTLPRRELRGGSYEILKCALIGDPRLFRSLAGRGPAEAWGPALTRRAVLAAVRLKARIVSRDEREGSLRRVLNLGHTFGHALEAVGGYRRFNHGEAVGYGLIGAAHIARGRGLLTGAAFESVRQAVDALGRRPRLRSIEYPAVRAALDTDKKATSRRPTFVLPTGIGRVTIHDDIAEAELRAAWRYLGSTYN